MNQMCETSKDALETVILRLPECWWYAVANLPDNDPDSLANATNCEGKEILRLIQDAKLGKLACKACGLHKVNRDKFENHDHNTLGCTKEMGDEVSDAFEKGKSILYICP
jgi:hypothetical protein